MLSLVVAIAVSFRPAHPAYAGTVTDMQGGVQTIVTEPDVVPSAHPHPKKRKSVAVVPRPVPTPGPSTGPSEANMHITNALVHNAEAMLGRPFRMGGASPAAFDCSGFVQYVFATVGVPIPRTADVQFARGRPIAGPPLPGDLVFFQTYAYGPSHVGLYLGGGRFINAIERDVHVSDFNSGYFRGRYLGARRYLPD